MPCCAHVEREDSPALVLNHRSQTGNWQRTLPSAEWESATRRLDFGDDSSGVLGMTAQARTVQ
jgi:hypothetical protein